MTEIDAEMLMDTPDTYGSELSRRTLLRGLGAGAAAAAGLSLVGCGSSSGGQDVTDPSKVSGHVTMWIYPIDPNHEKDWWPARVSAFTKKYSKVKVEVVVQPWADRDTQLTTAIAGQQGPDVVYLIPDQVPQYAATGALADVSDVISKERSDFRANALAAMTYNNTLYGVPLLMGGGGTLVNTKILKAAGIAKPPVTWDDVLAAAPILKSKGYYATLYEGDVAQTLNLTFYPLLWQAGGDVLSKDGKKAAFNSSAGVAALSYVKQLVDGGYVPKDAITTTPPTESDPVALGKVAFVTDRGAGDLTSTAGINAADWTVVAPLTKAKSVGYGVVGGLSVLAGSKNTAAAKAWVNWLTAASQMKPFDIQRKYDSPRVSAGTLFTNGLLGEQEKFDDRIKSGVIQPQARQLMDLIKPEIQAALLGKASPQAALDSAAKQVNALLARG